MCSSDSLLYYSAFFIQKHFLNGRIIPRHIATISIQSILLMMAAASEPFVAFLFLLLFYR